MSKYDEEQLKFYAEQVKFDLKSGKFGKPHRKENKDITNLLLWTSELVNLSEAQRRIVCALQVERDDLFSALTKLREEIRVSMEEPKLPESSIAGLLEWNRWRKARKKIVTKQKKQLQEKKEK